MSQKDDEIKRMILERRARFIAAALSASGLVACGAKSADSSAGSGDGLVDMPTTPNPATPAKPTVCLSLPAPTACLSPLPPTNPNPTAPPPSNPVPQVVPTVCLSFAPTPPPTAPTVTAGAGGAGGAQQGSGGSGGVVGVGGAISAPAPTPCLSIAEPPPIDEPDLPPAPVGEDAGTAESDGGIDAGPDDI